MKTKLSLVIPVYNAESFIYNTLVELIKWRERLDYHAEIIVVNDGSIDNTLSVLSEFKKKSFFKLISYNTNKGKGAAIKKGMMAACGEYRIFTDADIPFGFNKFDIIIDYLSFKEFDVCIGDRSSVHSKYAVKMRLLRKISSKLFTILISRYVVTGTIDTQCGLKGFKAEIADKLFSKQQVRGFAFDVEILYLCHKYGFDVKRIPVTFQGNSISTINLLHSSIHMLWDVLCLPIRYHLLKKY